MQLLKIPESLFLIESITWCKSFSLLFSAKLASYPSYSEISFSIIMTLDEMSSKINLKGISANISWFILMSQYNILWVCNQVSASIKVFFLTSMNCCRSISIGYHHPTQTIWITLCKASIGERNKSSKREGFWGRKTIYLLMQVYAIELNTSNSYNFKIDTTGYTYIIATSLAIERSASIEG